MKAAGAIKVIATVQADCRRSRKSGSPHPLDCRDAHHQRRGRTSQLSAI